MANLPQPLWATLLAVLGVVLAIIIYCIPGDVTSRQAGFQIASALVSGALGAFAGHAANDTKITGSNPVVNQTPATPSATETKEQTNV